MTTEKEKFTAWLEREEKKGLTAFHITPPVWEILMLDVSEEEVFKQLNEMNDAVDSGLVVPLINL